MSKTVSGPPTGWRGARVVEGEMVVSGFFPPEEVKAVPRRQDGSGLLLAFALPVLPRGTWNDAQVRVYEWLATTATPYATIQASVADIVEGTGLSRSSTQRALHTLEARGGLRVRERPGAPSSYTLAVSGAWDF